jgi:hypothetical protein
LPVRIDQEIASSGKGSQKLLDRQRARKAEPFTKTQTNNLPRDRLKKTPCLSTKVAREQATGGRRIY